MLALHAGPELREAMMRRGTNPDIYGREGWIMTPPSIGLSDDRESHDVVASLTPPTQVLNKWSNSMTPTALALSAEEDRGVAGGFATTTKGVNCHPAA